MLKRGSQWDFFFYISMTHFNIDWLRHFSLLWNHCTEFIKLDRKQDLNVLYQVCVFQADQKNKMAALASDWLRHFRLLLRNRWSEFNETWQEENLNVLYKVCVFWADRKTRWPPWPLICWDIFDMSSETAERNSTKLDRKQDLNCVFQADLCFWADRKNMMTAAYDWLRYFFYFSKTAERNINETWQKARTKRPLPSLCFSGWSANKNGGPSRSVKKVAHCTQVQDMWPFGPLVYVYTLYLLTAAAKIACPKIFLMFLSKFI